MESILPSKQTDIIKQWQLIMVSLQLKPDIILGFT